MFYTNHFFLEMNVYNTITHIKIHDYLSEYNLDENSLIVDFYPNDIRKKSAI